ncbi:hypothetical protein PPBDW_I10061 [Photobacterium kishitanii]|nr:hypothetical protein PPBDW_I10061 [Photobacterium kishitanii]
MLFLLNNGHFITTNYHPQGKPIIVGNLYAHHTLFLCRKKHALEE